MTSPTPNSDATANTTLNAVQLSPSEKTALKAQAHGLDPVVTIGDKGLSPSVLKEVELALTVHGLIKIRVHGDERETRVAYAQTLCQTTGAALVQHIGKLLVLYRPSAQAQAKEQAKKAASKKRPSKQRQTKRQALS